MTKLSITILLLQDFFRAGTVWALILVLLIVLGLIYVMARSKK